jgi:hypothetical protein
MVVTQSVRAGDPTIKTERFMITDGEGDRRAAVLTGLMRVILPQPGDSSRYLSGFSIPCVYHWQWLIGAGG